LIGVMSDSHDNLSAIRKAVELFNEEEVELVIHAGDIISPFTIREFGKLKCPLKAVTGNNDGDLPTLKKHFSGKGEITAFFLSIELDGRKIAVNHGHYPEILEAVISSKKYDIVIYGHTHEYVNEKRGETLVLNPGESCGYLTGKMTVALLDVKKVSAEIITL